MKRKFIYIIVIIVIIIISLSSLVGCNRDGDSVLILYGWGDQDSLPVLNNIIDEFNRSVGKRSGYRVKFSAENVSYETLIEQALSGKRGPDVFFVKDQFFKKWTKLGFLEELDTYLDNAVNLENMWSTAVSRYRYNILNNTSNDDAPLYGLPLDNSPTLLYYNKTAMEDANIIVISQDDINETFVNQFNAQHNTSLSVIDLDRGFYRENPYIKDSLNWTKPSKNEIMVFNNCIPMSWDEIEDVAGILTNSKNYNTLSPTSYGYYTEWWFNYAFGIGGDCIADTTGDGDWVFTLGDENNNYIVNDNVTINGNSYNKNDFVNYNDKVYLASASGSSELNTLVSEGSITELPSTYEAFARFVNLSQTESRGGLQVSPTTTTVTGSGQQKSGFFANKKVAMLVDYSYNSTAINRLVGDTFEWDVAPLPIYKTYNIDKTVAVQGLERGHSSSSCLAISSKSNKKDKAYEFISYISGEQGQKIMAESGFNVPNQRDLLEKYYNSGNTPKNIRIIEEAVPIQTAGDWWYMPDKLWIDGWATALNQNVRNNGSMTLAQFITEYTPIANEALKKYKK